MVKYLIIGAGLAGLYTAYRLLQEFGTNNIIVIEKENRLGGRWQSLDIGYKTIELGAGVLLENHKYILNLINELNLQDKLQYSINARSYADIEKNGSIYKIKSIERLRNNGFLSTINDLHDKIIKEEIDYNLAQSYSLYQLISRTYGPDRADLMNYEFGYDGDFREQNAIDGINIILQVLDVPFYTLKGGLIQVIDSLRDYLILNGVQIYLNTECQDVIKQDINHYICVTNKGHITAEEIILAVPKNALCKFPFMKPFESLIDTINTKSLMRIYLLFPVLNEQVWFGNKITGIITTKTILRQIIPEDIKNGLLMIYSSGITADDWNYLDKNNKLESEVMYYLRKIFNDSEIPNPLAIYKKYWKEGTHMWKPSVDSQYVSRRILKPWQNEKIFVVGESYSLMQQWSQGTLQTVNDFINLKKLN